MGCNCGKRKVGVTKHIVKTTPNNQNNNSESKIIRRIIRRATR